jgi:hypothetical protein
MEKMSKDNERKLLKALDKAATMSIGNSDPDDVLIKVATEYKLTPPELSRVVEAYNKAKSVAYLKKAAAEDRAADFPIADMSKISGRIYGMEKIESEAVIPLRDYASMYFGQPLEKTAAEEDKRTFAQKYLFNKDTHKEIIGGAAKKVAGIGKHVVDKAKEISSDLKKPAETYADLRGIEHKAGERVATPRARESVWKEAMDHFHVQDHIKTILTNRVRETMNKRACELKKIAEYCEHFRPADLVKVARTLVNGYGEKHAEEMINELNMNMKCNRLPRNIEKTAHAVIFPCSEPYLSLSKIAALSTTLATAKKDLDWFVKEAEDEGPNALAKRLGDVTQFLGSGEKARKDNIDINTGMPTEWDNYLKELNSKRMLYNLYRSDPVIQSYPLYDVADTYNEVLNTTPSLADNKAWMRAALRRSLTQGKAVDPFEIKDMLMANKEKTVGAKNYTETVARMGQGDEDKGFGGKGGKDRGGQANDFSRISTPSEEEEEGNA